VSSQESDNLYELKLVTRQQALQLNDKLDQVQTALLKQLRSQGFKCLRRGVAAVEHSVWLWAERSLS